MTLVRVGDEDFALLTTDEAASTMAALDRGSVVHVTGKLRSHEWESGQGTTFHRVVLEVETVEMV